MFINTTYSFTDLAGTFIGPSGAAFPFIGLGIGEINVQMLQERTAHDMGSDGIVMPSKIAGRNGKITISMQQTSSFHKFLLSQFNIAEFGPSSMWCAGSVFMKNIVEGSSHVAMGVSFDKIPDKPYQQQGQRVTWVLWACDITNEPF